MYYASISNFQIHSASTKHSPYYDQLPIDGIQSVNK